MPNGNQPAFNTNLPAAIPGACHQLPPQMSFAPQPLCNVTAGPNLQQNRSNNHPSQNANSNRRYGPRNFSTKKFQHDQEVCHLNALLKQERGSNSKLVRDKKYLEEQCAKIKDELLEKDAELETLKQSKVSRKAVRDATTQVHVEKNAILTKKKPGEDSCINHSLQISELKRDNKKLREEKKVLENNLKDLEASKSRIENLQAELQQCKKELKTTEGENRELKVTNEQISRESQQKLNQMASENEAKAITYAKLTETFEGLQRDFDLKVKDNSLQLSELNAKNKKLEEENEMMKANHKQASTPMLQKLQTELDNRKAELLQCSERLEKAEEENNRLKNENSKLNQDLDDFEDIVDQNAKDILRLRNSGGASEHLKSDLDICQVQIESYKADLEKTREEKNGIVAERERLKTELKASNETIEIWAEKRAKLGLKLKMNEDKCKEYIAEIENLKQDSAQSKILKAELASAKTANERLGNMNKELKKEAKRLWNKVFVDSSDGQGSSEAKDDGNSGPTPPKKKKPNNAK